MRPTLRSFVALIVCATSACAPRDGGDSGATTGSTATAGASTTTSGVATSFAAVGHTSGFAVPEAVRYDPELDVYFVSNIDGNPSQKDNRARISVVKAGDTTAAATTLVEGGRGGATLHAPKGLAIVGDTLWVADIDVIRAFDKRTGKTLRTLSPRPAPTFLNDVVAADGAVYVTDTGIRFDAKGGMTGGFPNRIYRVRGDSVAVVLETPTLENANGIAWDAKGNRFLLAGFGGKQISAWTPGATTLTRIADGPGGYDGLEVLPDGRVLVTSWTDSTVHVISANGTLSPAIRNLSAPADIGIDTKRNVVAVPRFNDGRVEYFRIP